MSSLAHDPRGFLPYLLQAMGVNQGGQPEQPNQPPQLPRTPAMAQLGPGVQFPPVPQQPQRQHPTVPDTRGEQARFQAAIEHQTRRNPAPPTPQPQQPMGPSPEQLAAVQQDRRQKRLAEVEGNIGPGATEFAPGQFYKGPARVGGTARRDNFSSQPGQAQLPPTSSGRGTLSMMQANEILPSNPVAKRDYQLQRSQQEAAIAQAEAAKEAFEQSGQGEPQPPEDAVANLILNGLLQRYQQDGDIEGFQRGLQELFQTMKRFSPDQMFAFPGANPTTEG